MESCRMLVDAYLTRRVFRKPQRFVNTTNTARQIVSTINMSTMEPYVGSAPLLPTRYPHPNIQNILCWNTDAQYLLPQPGPPKSRSFGKILPYFADLIVPRIPVRHERRVCNDATLFYLGLPLPQPPTLPPGRPLSPKPVPRHLGRALDQHVTM